MHKRILNELTLVIDIAPYDAPLLIKSGRASGADPTLLDMNFVRTTHPQTGKRVVFLPGSSLKGTLRSYAERIARSVKPDDLKSDQKVKRLNGYRWCWCCNPFDREPDSYALFCGRYWEENDTATASARYADSCIICRIFGHTRLGSHIYINDAYPVDDPVLEQRDGVAIDRITGAVAAGPFNLEVVAHGTFRTTLTLRNFQLWQVGLLAVALRDMGDGHVPVGFGKSKGFGRVKITYSKAIISYPGQWQAESNGRDFATNLYDLSGFSFDCIEKYMLSYPEAKSVTINGDLEERGEYGRVTVLIMDDTAIRAMLLSTVQHWKYAIDSWPWPAKGGSHD